MSRPFLIRDSRPADSAAIAEIYTHWILRGGSTMDTHEKSASDIDEMISKFDDREVILAIEQEEQVMGWGIIKKYSNRPGYRVCCETSVYLRPGLRRQGLGSALKKALIERCRQFGYHHILARIWTDNEASIDYNRRMGYEVVGIQRQIGHCHGEWRDICIMQLVLDDVPPYRPELGWPENAPARPKSVDQ